MRFRSGHRTVLCAVIAATLVMPCAQAQEASGAGARTAPWPPDLRRGTQPAWQPESARTGTGQTGGAPSRPWLQSGGSEAVGRIGLPSQQAGTGSGRGEIDLRTPRTQASGLAAQSEREAARQRAGNPGGGQASNGSLRLRGASEDDLVPEFEQDTGADFARRARLRDDDPFAPTGIRAGAFTFFPSVELRGGQRTGDGDDLTLTRVQPELRLESGWSRHALSVRAGLRHESYSGSDEPDDTTFDVASELRIDINRDTTAEAGLAWTRDRVSPTDPDLPATALQETSFDTLEFTASLQRRFGRFIAQVFGAISDFSYGETRLESGGSADNSEQDFREYVAGLRLDYEATDRLSVFVEGEANVRDFDTDISSGGLRLGSEGISALTGVVFSNGGKLNGELAVGYQHQGYDEPSFDDVNALLVRGSLVWQATGLTTVTLAAESDVDDSSTGGEAAYTFTAGVAHALRRNLIVNGGLGVELEGSSRSVSVEAGVEYLMTRSMALVGDIVHEHDSGSGSSSDETTVTVGLRLQR